MLTTVAPELDEIRRALLLCVVEQAAESIVITDPAGAIVHVNAAFSRISGYTASEVIGQNPRILKSGTQTREFYQELWRTITAGCVWSGQLINCRKDGSNYEVSGTIAPVRDGKGEITNFVAVMRDLAHERELENRLRQTERMESIGRFAGGVAHDFNNMLTVIRGYSELMLTSLESESPLRRSLTEVIKAADRAGSLTQQLLAFGRQQVLQPRRIDLNFVVMDTEPLLRRLVGENIELLVHASHPLGQVKADPGQIVQILLNLAANARDAMPSGGRLTVETANVTIQAENSSNQATAPGDYVMLAVSDTGVGMDAATKARVFEPFFTTKELGRGTGLGLSTVYGIVKQSGGDIWIYSEVNQGSCFKIYFPRLDACPSRTITNPPQASSIRGGTVLLVEDEVGSRELIAEFLERRGFKVISASGGTEAMQHCLRHKGSIDVMLSDVNLPGLSGPDLAKFAVSVNPRMKIIYMSGYTNGAVTGTGVVVENCDFLQKPFSLSALEQLCVRSLGTSTLPKLKADQREIAVEAGAISKS